MNVIALVVEGQSEERFVTRVLVPWALARGAYGTPIVTPTKRTPTRTHKGGAPWREYDRLVRRLDAQPQWHTIGVLFDLYGCPADTPGFRAHGSGPEYHREVSAAVDESFRGVSGRVRPYAILHEFETLVLAAIDAGAHGHLPASARDDLRGQVAAVGEVELVNGARATSPSPPDPRGVARLRQDRRRHRPHHRGRPRRGPRVLPHLRGLARSPADVTGVGPLTPPPRRPRR